jgi:hypothetical protein
VPQVAVAAFERGMAEFPVEPGDSRDKRLESMVRRTAPVRPALDLCRDQRHGTEQRTCLTFCIKSESNRRRRTMSMRH